MPGHAFHNGLGWVRHGAGAATIVDVNSPSELAKARAGIPAISDPQERAAAKQATDLAAIHVGVKARTMTASERLHAEAEAKRAEAQRAFESTGTPDRAAGRLNHTALKQAHRSTDAALQRHAKATAAAQHLDHKAALAKAREDNASRVRLTGADLKGARTVRTKTGWHRVVRVNGKSVTVKTGYSWNDTIAHDKILEAR